MKKSFVKSMICLLVICFACEPVTNPDEEKIPEETPEQVPGEEDTPEEETPEEEPPVNVPEWESADEAVANMGIGWNLGNTLDALADMTHDGADWRYWETCWGQSITKPELMTMMKEAGFNAVRVPVSWGVHMGADGKVYSSWMNRVHEIVDYVIDAGLYCIVNIHHDTGADEKAWLIASGEGYQSVRTRYESLWRQIAEQFKEYDHHLLFESYNEMLDSRRSWCFASFNGGYDAALAEDAYDAINDYAQSFVDVVRSTGGNNSVRNLIVNTYGACSGAGTWNPHLKDPLIYMDLPEDSVDGHLIFEVHAYPDIDDLSKTRTEVEDMFEGLNTHLVSKGAPVIIGEWGNSSENPTFENKLEFMDYFVTEASRNGFGTFYWMGLSDGPARSLPAFNQPEEAKAIAKAYHGDGFTGKFPVIDDYDIKYAVTYTSQWAEANLSNKSVNFSDYTGIRVRLASAPGEGNLAIKVYGDSEGKEQYSHFSTAEHTVTFKTAALGSHSKRITLQYMKSGSFTTTVTSAHLIGKDGSETPLWLSPFWGCSVDMDVTNK